MGRKKKADAKVDAIDMIINQSVFSVCFFKDNPQCRGCEHVEQLYMDFAMYNRWIKKDYCLKCKHYTGWKYFGEKIEVW